MDMEEDVSRRVQVKFVTKLKAPLKVPETSIALPSTLTRSGLSAIVNNLLQSEIEYIRAVAPRKEEDPSLHDDWVSAVDGSSRVWKTAGVCTHILEGHSDAVTSVGVVKTIEDDNLVVATGSKDRTVKLWKIDAESQDEDQKIRA
nr:ribosome biogenesis protein WDR12 homolog [Tanacetum cinerariifolium]